MFSKSSGNISLVLHTFNQVFVDNSTSILPSPLPLPLLPCTCPRRQRELAVRVLETRLDQREQAVLALQDSHRLEVAALKKSLRNVSNLVIDMQTRELPSVADRKAMVRTSLNAADAFAEAASEEKKSDKGRTGSGSGKSGKRGVKGGSELVNIGQKMLQMTEKVNLLADLVESASTKASESEEEARQLHGQVEDLLVEKENLLERLRDLENLQIGKSKQATIATRLVTLSEDVRTHKLASLQQKRHIQVLVQEKRHLQNIIVGMEVDVEDLEQGKVLAETKNLLGDMGTVDDVAALSLGLEGVDGLDYGGAKGRGKAKGKGVGGRPLQPSEIIDIEADETVAEYKKLRGRLLPLSDDENDPPNGAHGNISGSSKGVKFLDGAKHSKKSHQLSIHVVDDEDDDDSPESGKLTSHELLDKMQKLNELLAHSRQETSEIKIRHDRAVAECEKFDMMLREQEDRATYYERILADNGWTSAYDGRNLGPGTGRGGLDGQNHRFMREEQDKMQEAANATIGSLRSLLDERNRQIEKYREKIEELHAERRPKSKADLKADELLDELDRDDVKSRRSRSGRDGASDHHDDQRHSRRPGDDDPEGIRSKLMQQIEQADELLLDKDRTIQQLEQRLEQQNNQRERAEVRCGAALQVRYPDWLSQCLHIYCICGLLLLC